MSEPHGPPDEAFKRLDARLEAAATRGVRKPMRFDAEGSGVGYRLIAELIGGVLAGLGLGWLADRGLHTSPIGVVSGVVIGAVASIVLAVRTATHMSSASKTAAAATPAVPDVEDDRDR